ncbi:MAG: two-CW domain-containing protein [Candidatus Hodarchaeales archaeon]
MKQNCWEYKNCGREPSGSNVSHLGICSATTDQNYNSIHGGKNGGRSCWSVAGTFCKGEIQGSFAKKFKDCIKCDFYCQVRDEEYPHFKLSASIAKIVEKQKLKSIKV